MNKPNNFKSACAYLVVACLEARRFVNVPELFHEPVHGLDGALDSALQVVAPLLGLEPLQHLDVLHVDLLLLPRLLCRRCLHLLVDVQRDLVLVVVLFHVLVVAEVIGVTASPKEATLNLNPLVC